MAANPITFRVKGLEQLQKRFNALPVSLAKDIDDEIADSCQIVVNEAKAAAPVNDGFLRQSIQYIKAKEEGKHIIQVGAKYGAYLEFGTGKRAMQGVPGELASYAQQFRGKGDGTYDEMIDKITEWVRKKGVGGTAIRQVKSGKRKGQFRSAGRLAQAIQERQVAKFIAFLILKNGLKPRPFLFPAYFRERPKFGQRIKNILKNRGLR